MNLDIPKMHPASPDQRAGFDAPGPGAWALDRSHYPGGTTPIAQWLMEAAMEAGMARVMAELGTPATALRARFVNGFMYTRLLPLIGPDAPPRPLPPQPVLRIVARLHPAFRRRARAARASLAGAPWKQVNEDWHRVTRPALVESNTTFGERDLATLDDAALDEHIGSLLDHCRAHTELHFWLHGYDLGPIARYLHRAIQWGADADAATQALTGASPSTATPQRRLVRIRAELDRVGASPRTLDDVRAASPVAAALLDEHLVAHGDCLVTGYDLTDRTLRELEPLLLRSILAAEEPAEAHHVAAVQRLRALIDVRNQEELGRLLSDARSVMDLRDDNGPMTFAWPMGLLRRALLAAGERLVARGALTDRELALEVTETEARTLCTHTSASFGELLAARSERRLSDAMLDAPPTLGPIEPTPPLDVLPAPLPEMVQMVTTALEHLGMAPQTAAQPDVLVGTGIGTGVYRGRVCTAATADDAFDSIQEGDVLVVRATTPAFNTVLLLAGGVVTSHGGPLSHAAVLARELGIPAIVGAVGALTLPAGALVELDPAAGTVRLVEG